MTFEQNTKPILLGYDAIAKDGERYSFFALNSYDALHWIINHLDISDSKGWIYKPNGKFKFQ